MPKLSQQGIIANFLVLLILVSGIWIGLYLNKNPQIFRSRAANPVIVFKSTKGQALLIIDGITRKSLPKVKAEITSSLGPPSTTVSYRTGFTPVDLDSREYKPYLSEPVSIDIEFPNISEPQFFWVEFKSINGATERRSAQIEIVPDIEAQTKKTPTLDTKPPDAPANLSAKAVSSSQINLSWSPSTDNTAVVGYDVYRDNNKLTTISTASYGDTGLLPATAYTYYVRTFDQAGNVSAASNVASAATESSEKTSGNITGIVYSAEGIALSGVKVSVSIGNLSKSYLSDSKGIFHISNIPMGVNSLNYKKTGYLSQEININVVPGETVTARAVLIKSN